MSDAPEIKTVEIPARTYPARLRFKLSADAAALAIGLPVRSTSPVEFWISMLQMLPPLNVKLHYIVQKGADVPGGKLGAAARNEILQSAINSGTPYVMFFDDDVLFPDMAAYRLWVAMQRRPGAGAVTGIYATKADPCEPLIYLDEGSGAFWDWALGDLIEIHSAGAGIQIVDMEAVKRIPPPWFNDVVHDGEKDADGLVRRFTWGHDRFFHIRLREEAKAPIYVDTGILCAHWDTEHQRAYLLPPDSPCFQRPPVGESFVPFLEPNGAVNWKRYLADPKQGWAPFRGYLEWLAEQQGTGGAHDLQKMVAA